MRECGSTFLTAHWSVSEPLTTVKNLLVYDPTTSTLNIRWDHAEGSPRQYKVFYGPTAGGAEEMVNTSCESRCLS